MLFLISLSAKLPSGGFVVAAIPVLIQVNPWTELLHHPLQSLHHFCSMFEASRARPTMAAVPAQSDTETGAQGKRSHAPCPTTCINNNLHSLFHIM